MPDGDETLFVITDLKEYCYCPRIVYYNRCLPDIHPVTYKMLAGKKAHVDERQRAARRTLSAYGEVEGERFFDVWVQSARLGLAGRIDEVVQTPADIIPVDYKAAQKVCEHWKMQLAAYGMLLEDTRQVEVRRGYLYLIPLRKMVEVSITLSLRQKVEAALAAMRQIVDTEAIPPPAANHRQCTDCEFRRFCNDV